jgi:hypothetical protein
MNLLAIGNTGSKICQALESLGPYKVYYVTNKALEDKKHIQIEEYLNPEDYERHCPKVKRFLSGLKGEVNVVLSGADYLTSATLGILEQIKDKASINILYVQPSFEMLNEKNKAHERAVSGVLQQYARGALFKKMYLVSLKEVEKYIGNFTITNYEQKLFETIAYYYHMLNVFLNKEKILGNTGPVPETSRIATFGFFDTENFEIKMFFPLEFPRELRYYFGIQNRKLENDTEIFTKIKNVLTIPQDSVNITYEIHSVEKQDVGIAEQFSTLIQNQNIDR